MNGAPIPLTRIVETVRAMMEHFRDELVGPRQATRTQLVRYLARELEVSEEAAAKLFDDFRKAGVIVRGDEPLDDNDLPASGAQAWAVRLDDPERSIEDVEPTFAADVPRTQSVDLLLRAIRLRATDVHLDPFGDEFEVRFRIDGRLEHYCRLSGAIGKQVLSQLQVMADLDPSEPFHPHEGRLQLPLGLSEYDIRITTTPVIAGKRAALRLLRRSDIVRPLSTLGFAETNFARVQKLSGPGEGLVLVAGPSGAGKSTTLYSLVRSLDDGHRNIVTIEDPVEYMVPEFAQLQIDPKHGLAVADEVKAVLRMDPDVIMIGEIRDAATAAAAMRAAVCGKYVFSSFHSRDASSVVTGLRGLELDDRTIADNLRAVVSQRLVRRLCAKCAQPRSITDAERELFQREEINAPEEVMNAVGCSECRGTGYHDRIGVFEVVIVEPELAGAIAAGKHERELRQLLRTAGTPSLLSDALTKTSQGFTTLEEVHRVLRSS